VHAGGIHYLELIILCLLIVAAALATLARRFQTPYPIILVIGGLALSLVPHVPRVFLRPDLVFLVILPPLLYIGAFHTSWRDFRANLAPILTMAFGLVGFTVLGVSLGAGWLLPGFDYRLGAVLGAVISTTDPIAATAIAKRLGLPRRITDIIEGESLVNDASGLLALQFTVSLLVTGERPGMAFAILRLLWLVCGGILVGLITGYFIHRASINIVDPPIEITFSLVTPYLAYLVAEGIRASGVLGAVICGLYLGRKSSETLSIHARLESSAVWRTLDFILNSVVFILIGLQLPFIMSNIRNRSVVQLLWDALAFTAFVIALRMSWVYVVTWLVHSIRTKFFKLQEQPPPAKNLFIIGWTGMRGVLALAAAISLPSALADGQPFPNRDLIIFLTFSVIFVTLVLQGLTLPAVIRKLGLATGKPSNLMEEQKARREILETVIAYIQQLQANSKPEHIPIYEDLERHYRGRLTLMGAGEKTPESKQDFALARYYTNLSRELRALERRTALNLRNANKINDELLRTIERELDLVEARYVRT
jgi:monovalent cation/hydrogen antiporter